jgi:hypothetical protein
MAKTRVFGDLISTAIFTVGYTVLARLVSDVLDHGGAADFL